ncbi:MAG: ribonuclease E/G, partial [Pseudomonadota bacterium]
KLYTESLPLFARYQVETYLGGMFNPTVQLKSGGYIVIGITEALVAIDVNSGRSTKEGSIEDTALKTNLEAADEVARQLRLRDLAGLIVIDFIDMDERKNNASVEKRMKDRLKTDRARIQVGRISGFGLMEMSRQRLRPGMIEATTQPCQACHGTGLIRSDDNLALSILRQIEEEGTRRRSREVLVKAPVGIANFLMNQKREHIAQIEARYGLSVRVEGEPHLVSPDFALEKFKTATRVVKAVEAPVVSVDTSLMDEVDEAEVEEAPEAPGSTPPSEDGEAKPKRRRRRRRRSRGKSGNGENGDAQETTEDGAETVAEEAADAPAEAEAAPAEGAEEAKPKTRTRRSRST